MEKGALIFSTPDWNELLPRGLPIQKIRLGQAGLAPENWLVVRQKPDGELIILHKRTNMIRVVPSLGQ